MAIFVFTTFSIDTRVLLIIARSYIVLRVFKKIGYFFKGFIQFELIIVLSRIVMKKSLI